MQKSLMLLSHINERSILVETTESTFHLKYKYIISELSVEIKEEKMCNKLNALEF